MIWQHLSRQEMIFVGNKRMENTHQPRSTWDTKALLLIQMTDNHRKGCINLPLHP